MSIFGGMTVTSVPPNMNVYSKNCKNCGTLFDKNIKLSLTQWANTKYCSISCVVQQRRIVSSCSFCKKTLLLSKSALRNKSHFCDRKCKSEYYKTKNTANCLVCGKSIKRYPSRALSNKNTFCSLSCRSNYTQATRKGFTLDTYIKQIKPIIHERLWKLRKSSDYKKWRKLVLNLNGNKCSLCHSIEDLDVHHRKEFSKYPELSLDVDNGQILCRSCHKLVHRMFYAS